MELGPDVKDVYFPRLGEGRDGVGGGGAEGEGHGEGEGPDSVHRTLVGDDAEGEDRLVFCFFVVRIFFVGIWAGGQDEVSWAELMQLSTLALEKGEGLAYLRLPSSFSLILPTS